MLIGLHVSSSGGVEQAPERAAKETGEALQIFAGSPRMWRKTIFSSEQGEAFQANMRQHNIAQAFVHVMYLTSYGAPDTEHRAKSVDAFITALTNCDTLGCRGAVTHLGSHKGLGFEQALPRIAASLNKVLASDTKAQVILENSAGAGGNIGNSFEELAAIIEACDNHPRLKICLDTAHAFTAGYDLRGESEWQTLMQEFDSIIGLDRLAVMHLNDSKAEFTSRKDRHENIGDGYIGSEAFTAIINDERLSSTAGILEVPGLDGSGPDQANVDRLRALRRG
ncbi:MAG: deoxyribonuclease IV [Candidatus Saccharimonadales bacterium]